MAADFQRLCRYTEALDTTMQRLAGRIYFFGKDDPGRPRHWDEVARRWREVKVPHPHPTLDSIADALAQANRRIKAIELDCASMRAHLDRIANDSWSRAEMKEHLVG